MKTRAQNLQALQQHTFDVCVIGGGITGAGVAREAALRGLKVALVEAQDFAAGTSSASSKLVHGGLRYLEQLELSLVLEALLERQHLLQMAPHLVRYGRFVLPLFKGDRVGPFKMGLGMCLYDVLSLFSAPLGHEYLSAHECAGLLPQLKRQDLQGAFVYSDAHMDDARLVIETLRSATQAGALCLNYAKAIGVQPIFAKTGATEPQRADASANTSARATTKSRQPRLTGQNWQIEVQDQLAQNKFSICAQQVMCAVGPWADEFARPLWPGWQKRLRPSKGVHLCIKPDKLKLQHAVVMVANQEKRIVFAHPHQGVLLVGTTDTDCHQSPSQVTVTQEDQNFLLDLLRSYFPLAGFETDDIISSFAGVRPLVLEPGDEAVQKTKSTETYNKANTNQISTSQISRRPLLEQVQPGLWFLLGGKYTTYRKMAFSGVEAMVRQLSLTQQATLQSADTLQALNPLATQEQLFRARLSCEGWAADTKRPVPLVRALIEAYGSEALSMLHSYNSRVDFQLSWREALYLFQAWHAHEHTWCHKVSDFYRHRTNLFFQYGQTPPQHLHKYVCDVFKIL